KSVGGEGVVEHAHKAILQFLLQIDQYVAARDEIEPGEGRVFDEAVGGEHACLADVGSRVILGTALDKPLGETLRRKAGGFPPIAARASDGDGIGVDVGTEDYDG